VRSGFALPTHLRNHDDRLNHSSDMKSRRNLRRWAGRALAGHQSRPLFALLPAGNAVWGQRRNPDSMPHAGPILTHFSGSPAESVG